MSKGKVLKDIIMKKGKNGYEQASKMHIGMDKAKAYGKKVKDFAVENKKPLAATGAALGAGITVNHLLSEKKAAKKSDKVSWYEGQKGVNRAIRMSDKGMGRLFTSPKYREDVYKGQMKGMGKGALTGSTAGGAAGAIMGAKGRKGKAALLGAVIGALPGVLIGQGVGANTAIKKHLKAKGIDSSYMGLSNKFSPEAKKKYIDKYRKKTASALAEMEKEAFMGAVKAFGSKALSKAKDIGTKVLKSNQMAKAKDVGNQVLDKAKAGVDHAKSTRGYGKAKSFLRNNPNTATAIAAGAGGAGGAALMSGGQKKTAEKKKDRKGRAEFTGALTGAFTGSQIGKRSAWKNIDKSTAMIRNSNLARKYVNASRGQGTALGAMLGGAIGLGLLDLFDKYNPEKTAASTMGLVKEVKGKAKLNEVMAKTPQAQRGAVLKGLRKNK